MSRIEIDRARQRARRLYRSNNFRGAYVRGAQAALAGRPADTCPYRRRAGGGWTAWRAAWLSGWTSVSGYDPA